MGSHDLVGSVGLALVCLEQVACDSVWVCRCVPVCVRACLGCVHLLI